MLLMRMDGWMDYNWSASAEYLECQIPVQIYAHSVYNTALMFKFTIVTTYRNAWFNFLLCL